MKGLEELNRKLERLDQKAIHERLFRDYQKEIISIVIRMAKAGVGPDDKAYKPYSESYLRFLSGETTGGTFGRHTARKYGKKSRSKKATYKPWLVSIKRKPHMLTPALFSTEVDSSGMGVVGWDGVDDQMNAYAKVHQGTDYGGEDHTKGRMPPRTWLHFESTKSLAVLDRAYQRAIGTLVADFNQGNL